MKFFNQDCQSESDQCLRKIIIIVIIMKIIVFIIIMIREWRLEMFGTAMVGCLLVVSATIALFILFRL